MIKRTLLRQILYLILSITVYSPMAFSETVVIVNPDVDAGFSKELIRDIFLYNDNRISDGSLMRPVNLSNNSIARKEFESKVLEMNTYRIDRYWAERIYSGTGSPPEEVEDGNLIKRLVAKHKDLIGYIEIKHLDDTVRVVHRIDIFTGR